jgi:hypothetical protein
VKVITALTEDSDGSLIGNGLIFGSWNPIRSIIENELYGVIGFYYVNPRENEDKTEIYQTNITDLSEGRYSFAVTDEDYDANLSLYPIFAFCFGEDDCIDDDEYNEYEFEEGFF